MMTFYKLCLLAVALINLLPVLGLLSAERLAQGYGITITDNDLHILLRHRALMFGIIGGFMIYALFVPAAQVAAMVMAGISMVGFLVLALTLGPYNDALRTVVVVDIVGIVALAIAAVLRGAGLVQVA